ncbi:hypothetical protein TUM20984_02230 [Mycobacterium antarcticum]|nr:hypothetical protein TUM20984_02230 [Mycolicibacterium sp. TUM20984]
MTVTVDLIRAPRGVRRLNGLLRRMGAFAPVELQKLSHDRSELLTRMVQPALWLLIFGQTFSRLRVIDTGDVPYLAFLAPGIIAQSALFISIFYGIQIVWDRDAGILAKLMVTPAPASALITGKAFAAGVRSVAQVVGVMAIAYLMGIHLTANPLRILAAMGVVVLGSAISCRSGCAGCPRSTRSATRSTRFGPCCWGRPATRGWTSPCCSSPRRWASSAPRGCCAVWCGR